MFQPTNQFNIIKDSEYNSAIAEIEIKLHENINKGYFDSFDGAKMFYEFYKVADARATIAIVHGYTEFTQKYTELAWYFMNMGYNVFIFDLRGHGFSHRVPEDTQVTHVDFFEDYVKDLECFMAQIVEPNSDGVPIYIYSHSLGCAISTMYLATFENKVEKIILSAPMVYPVCTPLPRQILRMLLANEAKKTSWDTKFKYSSSFNPDVKVEKSMDLCKERFQHNLDKRIREPHYQNSSGSNRWNYEILGVMDKLLKRKLLSNIRAKSLMITAGRDTVVKKRPQLRLAKLLKCDYKCFEYAKHALYTMPDENLAEYVQLLLDFFA